MLRKDETILACMKNGKGFMCSKGSLQSEAFGKLAGCGTAGTGTALKLNYAESCKRANVFSWAGRCAILIAMFGMLFFACGIKA